VPTAAASTRPPRPNALSDAAADWLAQGLFLVKVARPGFWTTSLWFYLLPLGGRHVFTAWTFWLGTLYVTLPLGLLIYGWNDLVDAETDRRNPRKGTFLFGARGDDAQLARLPWRIFLVQAPFAAAFVWLLGPKALLWLAALVLATAVYNWPPPGLKGRPPFDMLNQIGYLLVFVLSSWLNAAPQLPWQTFVFGALFAMHSHLFGQIMDVEPDRLAGRRTTAATIGTVPAKGLTALFLLAESALVYLSFKDGLIAGFLALGGVWFVLDALVLWGERLYRPGQMRFFLLGWNAAAVASMGWVWATATLTGKG
jgi:4-hydroxybenzoate polyprenyltransferase